MRIAASAARFVVQRHRAGERGASPPTIARAGPAANERLGNLTFSPGRSRQITCKRVDCLPTVISATQLFQRPGVQAPKSGSVMLNEFVSKESWNGLSARKL